MNRFSFTSRTLKLSKFRTSSLLGSSLLVAPLMAAGLISGCSDSAPAGATLTSAKASLDQYISITDKTVAAELTDAQLAVIDLVLDLHGDRFFSTPSNLFNATAMGSDISRACPRGGKVAVDNLALSGSQKRVAAETSEFQASADADLNADSCLLLTRPKYRETPDEQGNYPLEAVGPQNEWAISGKVKISVSANGTVTRAGGTPENEGDTSNSDYELIGLSTSSGKVSAQVVSNAEPSNHEYTFKDFGLGYRLTDENRREFKTARADPLGQQQSKDSEIEFLNKNIKCKGAVVIDGKEYDCASVAKRMIVNKVKK